ncbi:MAG: two-component system, NtrC family, sensor kinase [Acetobacteraceae bacterium]|nr:two-component system, NtrC family, sensor kinase [Acetobacteraceae bacterium]
MGSERANPTRFGFLNGADSAAFRYPDVSQMRESKGAATGDDPIGSQMSPAPNGGSSDTANHRLWKYAFSYRRLVTAWGRPWPLTARVPIVSGALILAVAGAVSHVLMSTVAHQQELSVRRLAAVYLDGISTTVYPHVVARNLTNTVEALNRTMWFHQSMREQRAMVRLPDGSLFAYVSARQDGANSEDPIHDPGLSRRLERGDGFVFDEDTGSGWAMRTIARDGKHVADLYVALELKPLIDERRVLRRNLLMATVSASFGAAAIGFMIVRRMVQPLRLLTERLRRAQAGDIERVLPDMLPPASSEYGRLLRGYNDLVDALGEREAMAVRLAQRERESVLGRLAATVAHEVRNPLGGMATALDTVRKFGDDTDVRGKGLDLVERGLWSIRNVVDSVLAFHRIPPDGRRLTPSDLEDLRVLIEPELARRHLRLSWRSSVAGTVDVAATETRQIALNLLLNACEASPPGTEVGFRAWVGRGPDRMGPMDLNLEVIDDGPGLPKAAAAALTEVGITDPHDPPRGLGIRVVRDLVRGLGGRIIATAVSEDHGSRIVVTLPPNSGTRQEIAT